MKEDREGFKSREGNGQNHGQVSLIPRGVGSKVWRQKVGEGTRNGGPEERHEMRMMAMISNMFRPAPPPYAGPRQDYYP